MLLVLRAVWGILEIMVVILSSWAVILNLAKEGVIMQLEFSIVFCGPGS